MEALDFDGGYGDNNFGEACGESHEECTDEGIAEGFTEDLELANEVRAIRERD